MLRIIGLALVLMFAVAHPANAQRGQQIFDLFLQGAQQELNRQQQLQFEQQQRQHLKRLHEQFLASWQACHTGNISACDAALAYPHISLQDRQVALNKRAAILAAEFESAQREHRLRIEIEKKRADDLARQQTKAYWQKRNAEQAEKLKREADARALALRIEQERHNAAMVLWGGVLILLASAGFVLFLLRSRLPLQQLNSAWVAAIAAFRTQTKSSRTRRLFLHLHRLCHHRPSRAIPPAPSLLWSWRSPILTKLALRIGQASMTCWSASIS